jgi:hypothetical protein
MATESNTNKPRSAGKDAPTGRRAARRTTKTDRLVRLLKATTGREIAALSRELGWQPHTTRAALTRLRKAGFAIEKLPGQNNGGSRYRIAGEPAEPMP